MSLQLTPNEAPLPLPDTPNNSVAPQPPLRKKATFIRNVIYIIFICLSYYAAWWIYTHGQELIDLWRYRFYTPTAEVVALADKTAMAQRGRYLFYVSDPKIDEREAFNSHCSSFGSEEHTAVLGCYRLQNIFLYNVTDPRLYGVKEVTAAHEMLHAAYERLPINEKLRINQLIQDELVKLNNPRIKETAELYSRQNASEVWNEMHSILGTEYRGLSPELEEYYKQYFTDRNQVVVLSEAYEGVFTASKQRIADYDNRLRDVKTQIDTNTAEIESLKLQLNQESARLDALRATDPAAYNAAVPGYNGLVHQYNAKVNHTRSLVETYNALVEQRNGEAAAQNDLFNNLNSQVQTLPSS